jgi:hypothetical protein
MAFGELQVARWPVTFIWRKIYISEARLQALRVRRQRLDQLCIPLRYLVAAMAALITIRFGEFAVARWPGGHSHI